MNIHNREYTSPVRWRDKVTGIIHCSAGVGYKVVVIFYEQR